MNFNSKETYLAAAAAWKLEHSNTIKGIRKAKVDFKNAQREFSKAFTEEYDYRWPQERKAQWNKLYDAMTEARSERWKLVRHINELQTERALAREEAGRQMELQKSISSRT